jgi:hypothetical protein
MDRVDYQPIIVQDLINWDKGEELDISPWYQRRGVWTTPQKAYLINTLFEQKPVPTLYFRHTVDLEKDKSLREVVDGQQRIRAILDYIEEKYSAFHPAHGKKVKYSTLNDVQKRALRETKLSGGFLLGADDSDVIEIFGRLNSVAKTLNAQEKRNAMYSGEFKQFCLKQAASRVHLWRDLEIFTANDIARMREMEFLSDIVLNFIRGLSDFSADRLNKIYHEYDDAFPDSAKLEKRLDACFSKIAGLPAETIKGTIFSRQPVFFSLILAIDETNPRINLTKLNEAILEIDNRFNSDLPVSDRPKRDAEFYEACRASTQRISTRKIRHNYISSYLK